MLTFRKRIKGFGLGGSLIALMALVVPTSAAPLQASTDEPGRIVNGEDIDISDAPWQVALVTYDEDSDDYTQFCGGSIYDETWIITAAHCFPDFFLELVNDGPLKIGVVAGKTDIEGLDPSDFNDVDEIVIHPDFTNVTGGDDIALLYLGDDPLTLNGSTITAIKLPESVSEEWPEQGTEAFATGWGAIRSSGPASFILQGIDLQVLGGPDDPECGDYGQGQFLDSMFDPDTMLCAGPLDDAGDGGACQGDSGGPLAIEVDDTWYLAGITSWGIGCGNRLYRDGYAPLDPSRVLDTRVGNGGDGPVEPGAEIDVDLAEELPENALAALVNLTATGAQGDGYLTAYDCASGLPETSNLNYVGVTTIANTAIVELGADMQLCLQSGDAATDVLVDLVGYFTDGSGYGGLDEPQRILSTRIGNGGDGPVAAGDEIQIELDTLAEAVVLNVTATNAEGNGYLTVYHCDDEQPDSSNLNYVGLTTVANSVIVRSDPLAEQNRICILVGDAGTDVLVDLIGTLAKESVAIGTPERISSTRISDGGDGPVAAQDVLRLQVLPPEQAEDFAEKGIGVAVLLNLTATNAEGDGYLTAYPCDEDLPGTSNLNYVGVSTIAGFSIVNVSDEGQVCVFVGDAATDILVDAMGSFVPTGRVVVGDFPDVYTRVTNYLEWIEDNLDMDVDNGVG